MAVTQINGGTQIQALTITNASIATGAAIALTKLANTVIRADGATAFTGNQDMGGFKLTGLGAPSSANDAARLVDLQNNAFGLDAHSSVRAATTANGTLATAFANGQVIDGVTLATNDRILLKNQTTGSENGIYTVNSSGAPSRAADAPASSTTALTPNSFMFVEEGTTNADTAWVLTNNGTVTIGTTSLVFTQFSGGATVTAGNTAITVASNAVSLALATTSGLTISSGLKIVSTNTGITVNTNDISLSLATTSGLTISSGLKIVSTNAAIVVNTSDITLTLDSTPGLQTTTGLKILLASNSGLTLASGLAVASSIAGTGLTFTSGVLTVDWSNSVTNHFIFHETPSGTINGSTTSFTLANTPIYGTVQLFLNGVLQQSGAGNDYTISGATITYLAAPLTGDKLIAHYMK